MRVLVCGSRTWTNADAIRARLVELPRGTEIVHGGALGADRLAGTIALSLGFSVLEVPADWRGLGRSAGYRRNLAMLDLRPDLVLAFWKDGSTGTGHTIDEAAKRGIPLEIFPASTQNAERPAEAGRP